MICDLNSYRRITKDSSSYDGDVLAALVEAQSILEDKTQRHFELAERTEKVRQYSDGRIYPSATPVVSVSAPSGSTVEPGAIATSSFNFNSVSCLVEVTYTGGYPADEMPAEIVRAVAEIAKVALPSSQESMFDNLPAGATTVRVGDVSVSGSDLQMASLPASLRTTLRMWRRRVV